MPDGTNRAMSAKTNNKVIAVPTSTPAKTTVRLTGKVDERDILFATISESPFTLLALLDAMRETLDMSDPSDKVLGPVKDRRQFNQLVSVR